MKLKQLIILFGGLILFPAFLSTAIAEPMVQSAQSNYTVYLTSWGSSNINPANLSSKVTDVDLAFGNIDPATLKPVGSDGILDPKSGQGWKEAPYNKWTFYKYNHKNVRVLLAFGGATYSALWTTTLTANHAAEIAKNIADALSIEYPVYKFDDQYKAHQIGTVTLNGVDLDVEAGGRLSNQEANNVILLIQYLRQDMPNKTISLTGFSTAADPSSCQTTNGPDCSFVGSAHSGELIPILTQVAPFIDDVNDMAYDAGKNYKYQISINNYSKYIEKNKVSLGLDLELQWSPNGKFLATLAELENRAHWAGQNGYGAMVWGLGVTSGYPQDQQSKIINTLGDQFGI